MRRLFARLLVVAMLGATACDTSLARVYPNDIAILFPLQDQALWRPTFDLGDGALLPRRIYDEINAQNYPGFSNLFLGIEQADSYDMMRVVSVRIEACAEDGLSPGHRPQHLPSRCTPQIRFVLQAVVDDGNGQRTTPDGAVHAIYHPSVEGFASFRRAMLELVALSPENLALALQVNPALAAQGVDGAYGRRLARAISDALASSELAVVAFMSREAWRFGSFKLRPESGQAVFDGVRDIVGVAPSARLIMASIIPGPRLNVLLSLDREPQGSFTHPDPYLQLAMHHADLEVCSLTDLQSAFDTVSRRMNPELESPDTVDCASCHMLDLTAASPRFATLRSEFAFAGPRVERSVQPETMARHDNVRAFGYIGAEPSISTFTANDVARGLRLWLEAR